MLATYGVNMKGEPYIHVKVYKQSRIYGNIVITGGTTEMQCRECLRWYRVDIVSNSARLSKLGDISPDAIDEPALDGDRPQEIAAGKVTTRDD